SIHSLRYLFVISSRRIRWKLPLSAMMICTTRHSLTRIVGSQARDSRLTTYKFARGLESGVNLDFIAFDFRIAVTTEPNAIPCTFRLLRAPREWDHSTLTFESNANDVGE